MAPKTPSVDLTLVTKNLRALQGALEHSLTIQRARLQEIVDDLVARGSLSRADADRLLNQLLVSSKDYSQALLQALDSITTDARKSLGGGIAPVMATAGKTAGKIAETVRQAPRLVGKQSTTTPTTAPKRTPKPASKQAPKTASKAASKPAAKKGTGATDPIPGYSDLTVAEIKPKLTGLSPAALRKVRDRERAGKARKSVLADIEKRLKG
ncbi:hypothetical protein [Nocardioides antri]|uniref:Uncharacterized protein n=1 Tax=Nocardioides antri TaxID=2607659 RepID=A0A5B1LU63_9ACTN|nr:hypothetical protein [Nocardioides antri]KAA1424076.1 hypothetical protein F0U47_19725 [Nocardioides antri]